MKTAADYRAHSEELKTRALALYAEARAIYKRGIWSAPVLRAYNEKYAEAHAVDMAHLDAAAAAMRLEALERSTREAA